METISGRDFGSSMDEEGDRKEEEGRRRTSEESFFWFCEFGSMSSFLHLLFFVTSGKLKSRF